MFTGDKERYERYLKGTLRQTGWITDMQLGDGGVCKEDIVVLTKESLISWLRAHFDNKAPMQEEFIAMLLGHVPTELTVDDFTVENALHVMDAPMCAQGRCTPERPFGQSTVWLPNKTPVHRMTFPKAALEFLAGKNDGVTYLDEWLANVHHAMRREQASEERAVERERKRGAGNETDRPLGLGDLIDLHSKLQQFKPKPLSWWIAKIVRRSDRAFDHLVIEASHEADAESIMVNFLDDGWSIDSVRSFEEWLRDACED